MQKNENSQEISKEVENSLELLILYRSLYIIKQKFSLFKERIKNIYKNYNIYKDNIKLKTNIAIYQIKIGDFVKVVDEVLQDINLLIIKYQNPKDIFFSKILLEKKREETKLIINEILNWLLSENNNGKFCIKNYNINFFNKKIKPYIEGDIDYEAFENSADINDKNINKNEFSKNLNDYEYKIITEYNRKGKIINKYKSKILEENGDIDYEGITETMNIKTENEKNNNDKKLINKELSINLNNLSNSANNLKKSNTPKFIFIESLPLILADFLQTHMNHAIVESEDELSKELKILFDNEILKRINEYENILKNKSSLLNDITEKTFLNKEEKEKKELDNTMEEYKKVKENIDIYRNIIKNKKKTGENVDYIEKMIEKLLAKQIWLEHRIKVLVEKNRNNDFSFGNNDNTESKINININSFTKDKDSGNIGKGDINETSLNKSKNMNGGLNGNSNNNNYKQFTETDTNTLNTNLINDKSFSLPPNNVNSTSVKISPNIHNALKEIFLHYSQMHLIVNKSRLFTHLEEKKLHLDLNEFSKFCSDFNIPIMRQKLVEVFNKNVSNLRFMTIKEFNNAINSLADAAHESRKKYLNEKINHAKLELKSMVIREKQMKEERKLNRLLYNDSNSDIKYKKNSKSRSPSGYAYKNNLKLEKKNIFNDISNNKINYNKENKKSYQEIINDFYNFLGLNNPQEYRSKMRKFNMSPVKTNENSIIEKGRNKSISSGKKSVNRSKSYIIEDLETINIKKSQRLQKELIDKEKMKNKLYKEKIKLFNINNQRLKITVDRKSKKKTYLELMKEKQEEKSEIIQMHNHQKNILLNKMREREIKRIKEKELEKKRNKEMEKYINDLSKEDSKEQLALNEISEIKKIRDEEEEKKNDKNQIWWGKLEKYNIEDLGMNQEEKDLFINSDLISEQDNNNINIIDNTNNNVNNSLGALILDNSLLKSNSKSDENNNANITDNKNNIVQPVQLPPINTSKLNLQKDKINNNSKIKNQKGDFFKTNQNNKNIMLNNKYN